MQVNGEGQPTGQPPAGSGDPNPPANTGGQGDPAPTTGTPPAGGDGGQQTPPTPEDPKELKAALERERQNARTATATSREQAKKIAEYEQKLKEIADAEKDELTKAQEAAAAATRKAEEATQRARQTALRFEITRLATAQNFHDPEDAYAHLMANGTKVEWNDQDEPQGVEKLVEDLAKAKPHLIKSGTGQQPGTPQAPAPTPVGALTGNQTPPDVDAKHKQEMAREVRTML